MADTIIETFELRKSFASKKQAIKAVDGVNLKVLKGEIFGFLGPNGAGKTTTLRMLATLLPIDGGRATVAGFDVAHYPHEVRRHVGYVSQLGGNDDEATGIEDLLLQGQLYGMSLKASKQRAKELTVALQLEEFAQRKIKTYSGGQKRRLNVATGIMHRPDVLFLDEPTTGLDPQNRSNLWDQVRLLRDAGTTVFLTTHYLDEADVLSDRLAIMDDGVIVAEGTPSELKARIAGDAIIVKPIVGERTLESVQTLLETLAFVRESRIEGETIRSYVNDGARSLPKLLALLDSEHVGIESVSLAQPSLDDVFLKQTGKSLRDAGANNGGPR
jgi:ABC-2 type transport system ATP-binding protein